MKYTLSQFNDYLSHFSKEELVLDTDTQNILRFIEKNIVIPTEAEIETSSIPQVRRHFTNKSTTPSSSDMKSHRNGKSRRTSSSGGGVNDKEWENMRSFKPTVMTKTHTCLSEIRTILNKISAKTFDEQCTTINATILDILRHESEKASPECDTVTESAHVIFSILANNKMLSRESAILYTALARDPHLGQIFQDVMHENAKKYVDSILNMKAVDPDYDFDAFCTYNKQNDVRKNLSQFWVELARTTIFPQDEVLQWIALFQSTVFAFIDQEGKATEVEEIVENLFLLIRGNKPESVQQDIQKMLDFSKTVKSHPSLTSRVIFKYMDM
jgi:hypothetical protein